MADAEGGREDDGREGKLRERKGRRVIIITGEWQEIRPAHMEQSPFLQAPLRSLASTAMTRKKLSSLVQTGQAAAWSPHHTSTSVTH